MKSFILYFYILLNLFSCLINPAFAEIILPADIVEGQDSSKSWIKNSHFEKNVNSVSSYLNTAGTSPVDGTGGGATITCTRTTSSPISGDGSLLITKDAANRQGQGCSIPFTIDRGDRATMQTIVLPYEVASGTFTAGTDTTNSDLVMWVYDVTNSVLIPVQGTGRFYSNTADYFFGYFQTNSNSTSYRLIFHQALTGTSAYTIKVDNIKIFKSKFSSGTTITDWVSYTPTVSNLGTGSTSSNVAKWRRVGDSAEYMITFQKDGSGGSGASVVTWSLVSGQSVDANKLPFGSATAKADNIGSAWVVSGGNYSASNYVPLVNSATTFAISKPTASGQLTGADIPANTYIIFRATVPIQGWESSIQQSDGYDSRKIVFEARTNPGTIATSAATYVTLTWSTPTVDHVAGWNGTDTYTIKTADCYDIQILANQNANAAAYLDVAYRIDGGSEVLIGRGFGSGTAGGVVTGTATACLNAGQTVQARAQTEGTQGIGTLRRFTIKRSGGGSPTISATELIAAGYSLSANKTPAANAALDFDTKLYDTHNAVTTGGSGVWKFTAPAPGIYEMCVNAALSSGNQTLDMYKNGVQGKVLMSVSTTVTSGCASVSLVAGEYISANPDGSVTFTATKNTNIYIKRLK